MAFRYYYNHPFVQPHWNIPSTRHFVQTFHLPYILWARHFHGTAHQTPSAPGPYGANILRQNITLVKWLGAKAEEELAVRNKKLASVKFRNFFSQPLSLFLFIKLDRLNKVNNLYSLWNVLAFKKSNEIKKYFGQPHYLPVEHYINLAFCPNLSSAWHFVNEAFDLPDILSARHFIHMPFCLPDVPST